MDNSNSSKSFKLPTREEINRTFGTFSIFERLLFLLCVFVAGVATLFILSAVNRHFLVSVPTEGGTLSEGIVGTPRFVNPLLATTDADRDLSSLVYSGLMKKDANGEIVTDLADSYKISDDGLTYTFDLKDAYFQDGTKVTADDVLFTVKSAQDVALKSSKRVEWEGVTAKLIDEKTISFTLKSKYAPFIETTTLGIVPKHIWEKIPYESWSYSDNNTKNAIGSGPYKMKNVSQGSTGIPDTYTLSAWRKGDGGAPNPLINTVTFHFYTNEDDLIASYKTGQIDALSGIDPKNAKALASIGAHVESRPLPRIFGLFFNPSQAKIFTDASVRKAINLAINKDGIVSDVLLGYGTAINGPIPASIDPNESLISNSTGDTTGAQKILEKAGWKKGSDGIYTKKVSKKETQRLSFEISTSDVPELRSAVDHIVRDLHAVGIEATPKSYETGNLNQDIIRPRKFQALFFGEVVNSEADLFAFWDSSQRNDPGLNISGYANTKTDKALEQSLQALDPEKRAELFASFEKEINNDVPAVFIYSPSFIYVTRPTLAGITLGHITNPEDRFENISTWYLATDSVWKIFARN